MLPCPPLLCPGERVSAVETSPVDYMSWRWSILKNVSSAPLAMPTFPAWHLAEAIEAPDYILAFACAVGQHLAAAGGAALTRLGIGSSDFGNEVSQFVILHCSYCGRIASKIVRSRCTSTRSG